MKIKAPKLVKKISAGIGKSVRLELIITFAVCLIAALIAWAIAGSMFANSSGARIDYRYGIEDISERTKKIAEEINRQNIKINDKTSINNMIHHEIDDTKSDKALICDLEGNILFKTENVDEQKVDIYSVIQKSQNFEEENYAPKNRNGKKELIEDNQEFLFFYPVSFSDGRAYLIVSGVPEGTITYDSGSAFIVGSTCGFIVFVGLFYILTNNKMKYIEKLAKGLLEISKGNLNYKVEKSGYDELASLADNINYMSQELNNKIESERSAERTKSELITNVSHDLKTPLTSIKGYLELIKEERYKDDKQLMGFVNIAYSKSEKLESLIKDLFEYTKLTSNGIKLEKENISLNGLLEQLIDELQPIYAENNVTVDTDFTKERVMVYVDGSKIVRVFENLMVNAVRYSLKPGVITVSLKREDNRAIVSIQNKCENISSEDLSRIFERFYRVEKSRSQETGGSGLGLAIAKNIVELHGGKIYVDCTGDLITFTVELNI